MSSESTHNQNRTPSSSQEAILRFGLFNAENLFLLFDQEIPQHYLKLTEAQWQKLSTSIYENKPLNKCLQIKRLIEENNPDILMFCEVGGYESLKNFNELFLQSKYSAALIEGNSDRHIDVGFLIKKDCSFHYDIVSNKNRPLNFLYPHELTSMNAGYNLKTQSHLFSRDCVELRLFTQSKEKPFLAILLTHLKSRLDPERIDPGGTERRSAELRTALNIFKELQLEIPNCPILFAGDFNGNASLQQTDPEFLPIYSETQLQDVLELANVTHDKRFTFYQIRNGGKSEGKQIDYCFLEKKFHHLLQQNSAGVYQYKDEFGLTLNYPKSIEEKLQLPSDHYPIFFNLEKLNF